jgi:hypothetical protein
VSPEIVHVVVEVEQDSLPGSANAVYDVTPRLALVTRASQVTTVLAARG